MKWEIEGKLARSSRPGYPETENIQAKTVQAWTDRATGMGIRTILCLLDEEQLRYYSSIAGGLLGFYRNSGFNVVHIPVKDYKIPALSEQELVAIKDAYASAEKPVLIHCSAGIDRTGAAVAGIMGKK